MDWDSFNPADIEWKSRGQLRLSRISSKFPTQERPIHSDVIEELICEALQIKPETHICDVPLSLNQVQVPNFVHRPQANLILMHPKFRDWYRKDTSGILVVEEMKTKISSASALTYFCSTFRTRLESSGIAVLMSFFCALHAGLRDPLEGPNGMMRVLYCQHLQQMWRHDPTILTKSLLNDLKHANLDNLHMFFRRLLAAASPVTVICIIDGISSIDTPKDSSDIILRETMRELENVVEGLTRAKQNTNLKLLVTYHVAHKSAKEYFRGADHIVIPEESDLAHDSTLAGLTLG